MKTQLIASLLVFTICSSTFALSGEQSERHLASTDEVAAFIAQHHRNDESIAKRCSAYEHRPLFVGQKLAAQLSRNLEAFVAHVPNACTPSDLDLMGVSMRAVIKVQECLTRLNLCGYARQEYEMFEPVS